MTHNGLPNLAFIQQNCHLTASRSVLGRYLESEGHCRDVLRWRILVICVGDNLP